MTRGIPALIIFICIIIIIIIIIIRVSPKNSIIIIQFTFIQLLRIRAQLGLRNPVLSVKRTVTARIKGEGSANREDVVSLK